MKYLIILFLFINVRLNAQIEIINGRILSLSDKLPLNFASVVVDGKGIGTSSNAEGFFELRQKLDADDILLFTHLGFESKKIKVSDYLNSSKEVFLQSKIITSQTILVRGSIGTTGITPLTFSKIDRSSIKQFYTNQDIPEVLSYQPSITFYSENGNGLGYNYLSIRGFDQRRISVSINGIPQNDPEDHNVYWLDFPDLLESTELIQIQRGSGSGIVGYPAVGGSINVITSSFSDKPRMDFSSSLGSYNTRKYSAQFSSGLISNKYSFYAKLSQTLSSGYRNSSWIDFKSFHISAVRFDDNSTTQLNIFGGPIADGLAYTGLPKFAVTNRDLRKGNYSYWEADNKNYTYTLERRPDEIENFSQPHFEILNELKLTDNITINNALFLVLGEGFFDYDGSWADTNYFRISRDFGFQPSGDPGNALIRAMVKNKQWGWIPRLSIKHSNGELILGGELRIHRSLHWGSLNFGENLPVGLTKDYRYYQYEAGNDIVSFYAHENYYLNDRINFLLEGQLAYHNYKLFAEKYLGNEFEISNLFFNPRIGMNYKFTPDLNFYFSFARVSREPRLTNYYDAAESSGGATPQFEVSSSGIYNFSNPLVKPETMNNFEVGTSFTKEEMNLSLNFYYMLFSNEIVKKGQVDRFGQPVTGNMDQTIHYGFEAVSCLKLWDFLEIAMNGSLSNNYVSEGNTFIKYKNPSSGKKEIAKVDLSGNRISGFPNITFNAIIKFNYENFLAQISAKYVGDFFTDNYGSKLDEFAKRYPGITDYSDNKVDPYFVTNIFASYNFSFDPVAKDLKLFIQVNNLFDNLYASYGIGKEFFPAAERNYLFGIKLGL
ncbi:MAG: TonB-dependent receptor [Ignavibacteriales bacterium]|nr:TonB-dependent receptor [Ignavibacteriales bacterium]